MSDLNIVALVPMRHESERVPEKNFRPLAGRPLYSYILETLRACPELDRIIVDTDSPIIRQGVETGFPEVMLLERPPELIGGEVPMNEVLVHDATQVASAHYLQTHSTNPLLRSSTISSAIRKYLATFPKHDSLFSVTPLQARLWDRQGRAMNHDPQELLNTQDLPPVLVENSCLYIFEREGFLQRGNRIGAWPLMYEMDAMEAIDIDEESDFKLVERLLTETKERGI